MPFSPKKLYAHLGLKGIIWGRLTSLRDTLYVGQGQNRTREIRPSGIAGRRPETWAMEKAKRARKAETPKQPSLCLMLRAPYFYPDPNSTRWTVESSSKYLILNDFYFSSF